MRFLREYYVCTFDFCNFVQNTVSTHVFKKRLFDDLLKIWNVCKQALYLFRENYNEVLLSHLFSIYMSECVVTGFICNTYLNIRVYVFGFANIYANTLHGLITRVNFSLS
jgi:hypothetical protein